MTGFDPELYREFERVGWDAKADGYHAFYGPLTEIVAEPLLAAAGVQAGTRLVDIGCGPGYVTARASERGALALGIDISSAMVALARRLRPGLLVAAADGGRLPIVDAAMDAVVGNFSLHQLPDPGAACIEFARVLRPGGMVAMSAWEEPPRNRLQAVFQDAIREVGAPAPSEIPVGPAQMSGGDIRAAFAGAGFGEVMAESLSWEHYFSDAGALWRGLLSASLRTGGQIVMQPPEVQAQIRAAFDRNVAAFARGGRLRLPVSVRVVSGRRGG